MMANMISAPWMISRLSASGRAISGSSEVITAPAMGARHGLAAAEHDIGEHSGQHVEAEFLGCHAVVRTAMPSRNRGARDGAGQRERQRLIARNGYTERNRHRFVRRIASNAEPTRPRPRLCST